MQSAGTLDRERGDVARRLAFDEQDSRKGAAGAR